VCLVSNKDFKSFKALSDFEVIEVRNSTPKFYVLQTRKIFDNRYIQGEIFYISELDILRNFKINLTKKEKRDLSLYNLLK